MQIMKRRGLVALLGVVLLPILASCELGGTTVDISSWFSNSARFTVGVIPTSEVSLSPLQTGIQLSPLNEGVSTGIELGTTIICSDIPHTAEVNEPYLCMDADSGLTDITFTVLSASRWRVTLTSNNTALIVSGSLNS